jgi:putative phosphoribosyl transferase
MQFRDRRDAGRQLADRLATVALQRPIVLAVPNGGVLVGAEVASRLHAPLEVFVAVKLRTPANQELAVGALAEGMDTPLVRKAARDAGLTQADLQTAEAQARESILLRVLKYRGPRPLPELRGRDAILVDDGLATGATAEAALRVLRSHGPRRLLLAVPVCAPNSAARLAGLADEVLCLVCPPAFLAVGSWYQAFPATTDVEVLQCLAVPVPAP